MMKVLHQQQHVKQVLLTQLQHSNIVRLHDVVHTDRKLMLVFECLDPDLTQYLFGTDEHALDMQTMNSFMY